MSQVICPSCGTAVLDTARFCTRCGNTVQWTPPTAVDQPQPYQQSPYPQSYQPPPYQQGQPYQQYGYNQPGYHQPHFPQQAYGQAPALAPVYVERKDRTTALLLAIFLGGWTWVYTYRRDAWKFWLTLGLNLTLFNPLWSWLLLFLPNIGLHVWAIVDVAIRPQQFYDNYPLG